MRYREAMIAWNPGTDEIEVGPWPDRTRWTDPYICTTGACESRTDEMSPTQHIGMVFIHFHSIVVGDHVPPEVAHREFLKIDEFRTHISPDIHGAADE
jgi:hypothetical protein